MIQRYENDLTMFATVRDFLNGNTSKTSGVPAIAVAVDDLEGLIDTLNERRAGQTLPIEGITQDKDTARTTLEEAAFAVSDPLAALAAKLGNHTLLVEVAMERSRMDVISADALNDFATLVADRSAAHATALAADYAVTSGMITAIGTAQTAFGPWVTKPRTAQVTRKGLTESIPALIRQGKELLRQQLDRLMSRFRLSDPVFYGAYRGARVIVDRHGGGGSGGGGGGSGGDTSAPTEAPLNLTLTPGAASSGLLSVDCDPPARATEIKVRRGAPGAEETVVGTIAVAALPVELSFSPGESVDLTVAGLNAAGEGPQSDVVTGTAG